MMELEMVVTMGKAKAREVTNMFFRGQKLVKDPGMKVGDLFTSGIVIIVFIALCSAYWVFSAVTGGIGYLGYISIGILIAAVLLLVFAGASTLKLYNSLKKSEGDKVTIRLDKRGIDYSNEKGKSFGLTWDSILAVRVMQECAYIIPKDITGVMISIDRGKWPVIEEYLTQNDIHLRTIVS